MSVKGKFWKESSSAAPVSTRVREQIGLIGDTEDVSGRGRSQPSTPSSRSLVQSEALPVLSPVEAERQGGRRRKG